MRTEKQLQELADSPEVCELSVKLSERVIEEEMMKVNPNRPFEFMVADHMALVTIRLSKMSILAGIDVMDAEKEISRLKDEIADLQKQLLPKGM